MTGYPKIFHRCSGGNNRCSSPVISNISAVISITGKHDQAAENQPEIAEYIRDNSGEKKISPKNSG
jgi:hypothetical protein